MSFIDDSEKNIERLMKEVTGGSVAGFVGRGGMEIDQLFGGSFHPDSGHGSKNIQILKKQVKDRKKLRKDMEKKAYEDGVELVGNPDPIGGHFSDVGETELITLAFDELISKNEFNKMYSDEYTPEAETEWKSTGWNYEYDKPGEPYKVRVLKYDDNSYNNPVIKDIEYDDNSNLYADDTYINKSSTNWEYIEGNK